MNALCLLFICFPYVSMHRLEHEAHHAEAVYSPIEARMQDHVPLAARFDGMIKDYYGYCPYWIDTVYYNYYQMELLTHCAYFSVDVDPATGSLSGIPNLSRFENIRDKAHSQGVVVHMTFTLFGNANVTIFLNNSIARQNAITAMSDFVVNYGIEGVNIDFEFVTSSVRDSFSLFMYDLSNEMWNHPNGRKDVYIAAPAVPEWYPGYDVAYLADRSDGLFIMAYGFHYSGSTVAGPVSPCVPSSFWGQYCCARSIGSYIAYGADTAKLLLGVPYYGYDWPTVSGDIGSNTTGSGTARIYYYAFQDAITYGRIWDDYSLTPWYRYNSGGWHQCWYDDSASLDVKLCLVLDSVIQGAGCWALGYDRSYDHLWNVIRRRFWDPSYVSEHRDYYTNGIHILCPITSSAWCIRGLDPELPYVIKTYSLDGRLLEEVTHSGSVDEWIGQDRATGVYIILISGADCTSRFKVVKIVR
jgi:spore germination protein YaaH